MLTVPFVEAVAADGRRRPQAALLACLTMIAMQRHPQKAASALLHAALDEPALSYVDEAVSIYRYHGLNLQTSSVDARNETSAQLARGNPVAVRWRPNGTVFAPAAADHWCVVIGSIQGTLWMHDPSGLPDLVEGGHLVGKLGRCTRCLWRFMGKRLPARDLYDIATITIT